MSLKDSYFTVTQAAKELGVTRKTISRWLVDGKLSAEKVGREKLIPKGDVYSLAFVGDAIRFIPKVWNALEEFLGYSIDRIILEQYPIPETEFTRAMIISKTGKIDYVEIWDKEYIGEKDTYQFRKCKNADWDLQDGIRPYIEMYIGVTMDKRVVATYRRSDKILKK